MINRRRMGIQLVLLPIFLGAALLAPDEFTIAVAVALLFALVMSAIAAGYLSYKDREAHNLGKDLPVLSTDAQDARTLLLIQIAGAVAGGLVILRALNWIPMLPRGVFLAIIAYVMILAAVPAIAKVIKWGKAWAHVRADGPPQRRKDDL